MGNSVPTCFGQQDLRVRECRICAVQVRCKASSLANVDVLLQEPILPRVPVDEDFGPYPDNTAAACAHAAILRVASLGKAFSAEQVIQPFLSLCRERKVRSGNVRRTIREILREMRVRGRIRWASLTKWRLM